MAKEKESTQISWKLEGSRLKATIPVVNESVIFDVADLHESWILFVKAYGIQQHASSFLAKFSFPTPKPMKAALAIAIRDENAEAEKAAREDIRNAKAEWLKTNAAKIRTELWRQFESYKIQMEERKEASRETKAEVEARVKAETLEKARATTRASLEAAGMPEDFIEGILAGLTV